MKLALLSGILSILALSPFNNSHIFGFIFLVPLFIFFVRENGFWRLVAGAFLFRIILAMGTVYYTLEPIFWVSSTLIFLGLPVAIYALKRALNAFPRLNIYATLITILSIPFLWTLFDHLQSQYSPLPTYIITAGNIFGSSPFLGLSAIGGLITLTFFAAFINALTTLTFFRRHSLYNVIIIIIVITLVLSAGWQISKYELQKNSVNYGNLKNSLKIAVVSVNENFDKSQFENLKDELKKTEADFIIFPEDAPNGSVDENFYKNFAVELKTNLSATLSVRDDGKRRNSTYLFDANGETLGAYNKTRLTFIGENWPFENWRPSFYEWLKRNNPAMADYAVFGPQFQYSRGEQKLLSLASAGGEIKFSSLICLETHYPYDMKKYKEMGAKFFINPSSNRWIGEKSGVKEFLYLSVNLKKIESVWLKTPIVSSGVKDFAGVILPDGKTKLIYFENGEKNYAVFEGEIKY